jgi:hypothetical protein
MSEGPNPGSGGYEDQYADSPVDVHSDAGYLDQSAGSGHEDPGGEQWEAATGGDVITAQFSTGLASRKYSDAQLAALLEAPLPTAIAALATDEPGSEVPA